MEESDCIDVFGIGADAVRCNNYIRPRQQWVSRRKSDIQIFDRGDWSCRIDSNTCFAKCCACVVCMHYINQTSENYTIAKKQQQRENVVVVVARIGHSAVDCSREQLSCVDGGDTVKKKEFVSEIVEFGNDLLIINLRNGKTKILSNFKTVFTGSIKELDEKLCDERVKKVTEKVIDAFGKFYLGSEWDRLKKR